MTENQKKLLILALVGAGAYLVFRQTAKSSGNNSPEGLTFNTGDSPFGPYGPDGGGMFPGQNPFASVHNPLTQPITSTSSMAPSNTQFNPVNSPNIQVPTNVSPVMTYTPQNTNIAQGAGMPGAGGYGSGGAGGGGGSSQPTEDGYNSEQWGQVITNLIGAYFGGGGSS